MAVEKIRAQRIRSTDIDNNTEMINMLARAAQPPLVARQRKSTMSTLNKIVTSLLFALSAFALACGAQQYQCSSIAQVLGDYSISTKSSDYYNSVFDKYCEASGELQSSNTDATLSVVWKTITVGLGYDSSSATQTMRNFCKNYSTVTQSSSREFTHDSQVASKAIDSVNLCMSLQALNGTVITHRSINQGSLDFFLQASVKYPIHFEGLNGLNKAEDGVTCSGLVKGIPTTFGPATHFDITTTQNIHCSRHPQDVNGVKVYREAAITLSTDNLPYQVDWPKDERLPDNLASQIAQTISTLQSWSKTPFTVLGPQPLNEGNNGENAGRPHDLGLKSGEGFCYLSSITGAMRGDGQGVSVGDVGNWQENVGDDVKNAGLNIASICVKINKPDFKTEF